DVARRARRRSLRRGTGSGTASFRRTVPLSPRPQAAPKLSSRRRARLHPRRPGGASGTDVDARAASTRPSRPGGGPRGDELLLLEDSQGAGPGHLVHPTLAPPSGALLGG